MMHEKLMSSIMHRMNGVGPMADGRSNDVWNVEVGLRAGGLSNADRLVRQLPHPLKQLSTLQDIMTAASHIYHSEPAWTCRQSTSAIE